MREAPRNVSSIHVCYCMMTMNFLSSHIAIHKCAVMVCSYVPYLCIAIHFILSHGPVSGAGSVTLQFKKRIKVINNLESSLECSL